MTLHNPTPKPIKVGVYDAIHTLIVMRVMVFPAGATAPLDPQYIPVAAPETYYVFLLTNVASPGNIWVGSLSSVVGKFTCYFYDGGECASAGGSNVPLIYTKALGPFSSCAEARAAYKAHTLLQHSAFGGEKIYFDLAPIPSPAPSTPPSSTVSYFIDNAGSFCGPPPFDQLSRTP